MSSYITDIDVSTTDTEEQKLHAQGYKKINVNLNAGAGGNTVFIWYKKGCSAAITRVQVTFNAQMAAGLREAGYIQIMKNLNAGICGSDAMYMWYFRGSTEYDTAIVDMDVTTNPQSEAMKFKTGWERLACNLNCGAGGNCIHAWVKREKRTYICDLYVTDSYGVDCDLFQKGYIRVDEYINRGVGGVFIWYRQSTDPKVAITDLKISTNDKEYEACQLEGYKLVPGLSEETGGNQVNLWYKKGGGSPVTAVSLLLSSALVEEFQKAGINVLNENLSTGHPSSPEYLCFLK